MKLLRTIRFDESDTHAFERAAEPGEWAVPGGFEFAADTRATLIGKRRQAFSNGFLGLASFGRSTFVAVASIDEAERDAVARDLAAHFVAQYGAPSPAAALPAAEAELAFAAELCASHNVGVVLTVKRALTEDGVREAFRRVATEEPGAARSLWSLFDAEGRLT